MHGNFDQPCQDGSAHGNVEEPIGGTFFVSNQQPYANPENRGIERGINDYVRNLFISTTFHCNISASDFSKTVPSKRLLAAKAS
jgi:hypothetical protein